MIGLSALSADSSPREAPPACQLHSIREARPLLSAPPAPSLPLSSLLLCRLIYTAGETSLWPSCPQVATPVKRWRQPCLSFVEGHLIPHPLPHLSFFCILTPGEDAVCLFLASLPPLSSYYPKYTLVPPSSPKPLSSFHHNLQAAPSAREGRWWKLQNTPPLSQEWQHSHSWSSLEKLLKFMMVRWYLEVTPRLVDTLNKSNVTLMYRPCARNKST